MLPEHSKVTSFADPYTLVATTMDLKASYDAKNSASTAAAPKVFFKWLYINTITGEKSGEMMVKQNTQSRKLSYGTLPAPH